MSLELSQGLVKLHAGKIHLVHDATVKGETKRGGKGKREEGERRLDELELVTAL